MSKDLWFIEYERIADDWVRDQDDAEFIARMMRIGFSREEADEHLDAVKS